MGWNISKTVKCKDAYGKEYEVNADDLIQRIGVYAVIIKDGKILLTRQWGGYSIVGGGVDKGETLEEAFTREVKEETGLEATVGDIIYQTTTFFKKDVESNVYQSFQFYFTHDKLSGNLSSDDITESEKGYTDNGPEWVDIDKLNKIEFHHSVDLDTIMKAYNKFIAE